MGFAAQARGGRPLLPARGRETSGAACDGGVDSLLRDYVPTLRCAPAGNDTAGPGLPPFLDFARFSPYVLTANLVSEPI